VDAANDGTLNVTIGDGSNTATIRNLAANDSLNVAVVDGSGNQITSFGGSGGTAETDDAAFTAASGSGTPIMGFVTADTVDSGDVGVVGMDTARNLKVSIEADNVGIGGGTQYTEDAVAPTNPVGNALMAERDDALGGLTPIEGDWTHLYTNANGALWMKHDGVVSIDDNSGSITVDNGGTFVVQEDGAALTALQLIDDAIFADDAAFTLASSKTMVSGAIRDDSLTTLTAIEGDVVPLRVSSTGALHVTGGGGGTEYTEDDVAPANPIGNALMAERDDALGGLTPIEGDWTHLYVNANGALWMKHDGVVSIDDNSGSITVDNGGTFAVQAAVDELPAAAALTDNFANPTTTSVAGMTMLWDGATWDRAPGDTTNGLLVDLGSNNDVTISDGGGSITVDPNGGSLAINDNSGSLTVDNAGTFAVQAASAGDVAHDTADSGNPVKIGAKVETSTSGATLAADADRTDLYADADGTLITRTNHPLADLLHNQVSNTTGTSTDFTGSFAAAGASIKNYVTAITLHNSSGTDGYVDFRDGAAGSVLWTVPVPAGGGAVISNGGHPLFATSANTALAYDVSAALSTVYISVSGFKSKV
jgi:hypothetical protein